MKKLPKFDSMNEQDVSGSIVRPLISRLGYENGEEAYVRSERTLRYDRIFLGRKNKKKDPKLEGRLDYECGVIPHGRFIIEVKSPKEELTFETSAQAHTYATHPEVAAELYIITNGRTFAAYHVGNPEIAIFTWDYSEIETKFETIEGIFGPAALKHRHVKQKIDTGRPLSRGWPSFARSGGGQATADVIEASSDHLSPAALEMMEKQIHHLTELTYGISRGHITRLDSGHIQAKIDLVSPYKSIDEFRRKIGIDYYTFTTAEQTISQDPEVPTRFQNFFVHRFESGTPLPSFGGNSSQAFGFDLISKVTTEALGWIADDKFIGEYSTLHRMQPSGPVGSPEHHIFSNLYFSMEGTFEINLFR